MNRIPAIAICAAALIAVAGADARAQSREAISGMCATYVRQSWPEDYRYNSYQRARE